MNARVEGYTPFHITPDFAKSDALFAQAETLKKNATTASDPGEIQDGPPPQSTATVPTDATSASQQTTPAKDDKAKPAEDSAVKPDAAKSVQQTPEAQQEAKDGKSTDLPDPTEKAPEGMSADDIRKLNNGLLANLGDQEVKGRDAENHEVKKGGLQEVMAKDPRIAGVDKDGKQNEKGDLANDPDAAWRAYRVLTAIKNEKRSDGADKKDSTKQNGEIGGWLGSGRKGEAAGGSEAGSLQDYLTKGRVPQQIEKQNDVHSTGEGGTESGAKVAAKVIKNGIVKFGNMIKDGFVDLGKAIVHLGKDIVNGVKHLATTIGHGLKGLFSSGDERKKEWAQANKDGKALGDDIKDGAKQVGKIAETVAPMVLNVIPGVGTAASVAVTVGKTVAQLAIKGAEMAASGATKVVAKEASQEIVKDAGKEIAKDVGKSVAKAGAKSGAEQLYTDTTGETPKQTIENAV